MQCPRCQQENPSHAKFCLECGTPLESTSEASRRRASDAELQRALTEALEQQTATSEILRVISSSPTDVQPVFDAVAESAARLCDSFDALIFRVEGDQLRLVAHHGSIPLGTIGEFTVPLDRGTLPGRSALDGHTIHVADLQAEAAEFPEGSEVAKRMGFRTALTIPLMREEIPIGVIALRRTEIRLFSERQVALLNTFADQAVIAIENVRLFKELEARNRDLTATSEILSVIASSPTDLQPVLDALAESAARLCESFDSAVYRLDGDRLLLVANHGASLGRPVGDFSLSIRGTVAGEAVRDRCAVHVADVRTQADKYPESSEYGRRLGLGTMLCVPMMKESTPIGVIALRRTEAKLFTDRQVALLQTFADQAVIAIENVRLFTELQEKNHALTLAHAQVTESLEQQTATSDILRVIASSPTAVQPVFDTIVRSAMRLCDAVQSNVQLFDGELMHWVAQQGIGPEALESIWRVYPMRPDQSQTASRAILTRTVVHLPDVLDDPEYRHELALKGGWRGVLSVPMIRQGDPIGAITVARLEPGAFSETQQALLQTFADQAVIAIENVRLFTELQEKNRALTEAHGQVTQALEQQTATSEVLRTIAQTQTDVQPVFDTIVRSAARLCRAVNAAVFLTDGRTLYHPANYGGAPEARAAIRARYPRLLDMRTTPGVAILTRSVVQVPDIEEPSALESVREAGRVIGFRSQVTVPLLREGAAVGAIIVARREPSRFSDAEVALLKTFAAQAVIAIENVRLFNETREALEQQTATSEILQAISGAQTDAQPVFNAIARSTVRLCEASRCAVWRPEGNLFRCVARCEMTSGGNVVSLSPEGVLEADSLPGRVIHERQILQVNDVPDNPAVPPKYREMARVGGYRSLMAVPMVHEGLAVGVITVVRPVSAEFSDQQIRLVKTFADQAVIAIENVRLFTELERRNAELTTALDRQTATSEILRVISGAQQDAQAVFDTIVQSAVRLCRATTAAVFRVEDGVVYHPANYGGDPEALAAARARYPRPVDIQTMPGMIVLARSVVQIPDSEEVGLPDHVRQVGRILGFRSVVGVPMLREGEAVGALLVTRREPGRFSDPEVELLKTFSDQAVIAIENVRLFKELEARTAALTRSVEQLTALGEVGRAVSSTLDLETVLTTIVSRAVQLSGLDGGVVFEYDEDTEEFVLRVATETGGTLAEARRTTRIRKGEGVIGRTAMTLESTQVPDITVPGAYEGRLRETLVEAGVRAVLAVPMVYEGRLIGSLGVTHNRPGEFSAETVEMLRTFATQSALAIQNARLFREIEDKGRQLEAASRHKSEFLANMSHELRTPLNAVIGFSEVLLQRMFGALNDKQDEYLKDIYASGQHLLSLINDILDLSKIEAGRMELVPAPFHLPTALENAVTLVRERATRHGITLQLDLDPRLGAVVADERKVKQVLLNLLSNAVKFTPEGGRISLKAGQRDGAIEISVTDTGIGIAPEDQATIFEEFRQVGSDDARKQEGTGLGLTLAKKFIELHKGRIWVESDLGRGSTFTFTLPLH